MFFAKLVRWSASRSENSLMWRLLTENIPEHRGRYLAAVFAMIVVAIATSMTAWIMGTIIDSMIHSEDRMRVFMVGAAVIAIFAIKGLASFAQVVLMARAGNRIVAQKQVQLFQRLLSREMAFFNSNESSDLLLRVTQSAQMARQVIDTVVSGFVRDLLTLIGLLAVMFYQQPLLSLVGIVVGPVALYGVRRILARVRTVMAQEMAGLAEIIRVVQETSTGVRVVKAFALEKAMVARMQGAVNQVEKRANKMVRLEAATTPLMDTITGFAIAAIVVLSSIKLFGETAGTPGQLMSFITAFLMAYEPAKRLSRMRVSIEGGLVGVRMMYELLDAPQTMMETKDAVALPDGPGELQLQDVYFSYANGRSVLNGMSIKFPAGKTTALVGASGGGKSTVLNLILRLYDPVSGSISLDGVNLRDASFASLRSKIAYVGQDTFLFSAPVIENIRIARPSATDAEVIDAAKSAHADEFINQLPSGYYSPIGENGMSLSGGQRQRLAIARAILRRAPVLLLDEATSALDSHSEVLVRDTLEKITVGVTTIVVAHRLSTIFRADQICYLEEGKIVETGTLQELLDLNGKFRSLYDQQFNVT